MLIARAEHRKCGEMGEFLFLHGRKSQSIKINEKLAHSQSLIKLKEVGGERDFL